MSPGGWGAGEPSGCGMQGPGARGSKHPSSQRVMTDRVAPTGPHPGSRPPGSTTAWQGGCPVSKELRTGTIAAIDRMLRVRRGSRLSASSVSWDPHNPVGFVRQGARIRPQGLWSTHRAFCLPL